jgi:cation diffusion facilitator family transporter
MASHTHSVADREKSHAAWSSVFAAVGLTGMKLVVGIMTGSLGILAEAAHSGLDLVAAVVTLFAVKVSGRPADSDHLYGHGKIENLSAMVETLLLLATCVWIFHEAVERLVAKEIEVKATVWSFLIMAISIIVDVSRSRMLYRTAKKHRSQALEADALHFSTDVWSSSVVILGLFCVKISAWIPGLSYLRHADAIAAIIVALIVVYVSMELGARTVQALLDAAPAGMREKVTAAVEALPGVIDCHKVRIRCSGPQYFVDAHITVYGRQTLDTVHALTDRIEVVIQELIPDADVTVHPEPIPDPKRVSDSTEKNDTDIT